MQKTNFKTRLLALLTAAFMLVMCVPFAALADAPDVDVNLYWDTDQVEVINEGSFNCDNGYASVTVKESGTVVMPTVKGINGYEFKGWTIVGDKTELTLADVTRYLEVGKSTLQLKAIAEKAPVVADPSVTVDVRVDTNTMKITDYGQFEMVNDGCATAKFDKPGKELTLPTVVGINGYTFTGWDNEVGTSLTTEEALKLCDDGKTTAVLNAQAKAPVVADPSVTVDVRVDTNTMKITDYGQFEMVNDGCATAKFDKPGKELTLPTVVGINGYTFTGWDNEVGTSLTTEEALKLCDDGKTTAVLNAQAKAPVVADPSVTVDVRVDTNTMKITDYGQFEMVNDGCATAKFDKPGKELTLPTVVGINGYTFTGWDNEVGTSLTTEEALKLCDDGKTTAVLNAQAKAPVVADPSVTVDVRVDTNTMKITDYGQFEMVNDGCATAKFDKPGKELTLPTVVGINGYTFTGWDNEVGTSLTTEEALKLCDDGKTTAVLNAQAKAPVVADPSVTVDVRVDTNTMKITDYGQFEMVNDGCATAKFDKPGKELTLPTVVGINGYTFTGWDNEVGTSLTTEEALKLCDDGKTTAVLNAQAKAPEATNDKKDNSTSSSSSSSNSSSSSSSNSSSSSSSNKTTTASNEKQVVKAAAAPANTTKVLPKTGATNAAPLIGGSLAVVALLMGYGVYGLVLRKKD